MKVLMPYRNDSVDVSTILDENNIVGGVEKFMIDAKKLSKYQITVLEYKNIDDTVKKEIKNSDLVILNKHSKKLIDICLKYNVKVNIILHAPAGSIGSLAQAQHLKELNDIGIKPFFVSDYCKRTWNRVSERNSVNGCKLETQDLLIIPTYAVEPNISDYRSIDFVTIGRAASSKDPFYANKFAEIVGSKNYQIYTNNNCPLNRAKCIEYIEENNTVPDVVRLNVKHPEIMGALSTSSIYLSTSQVETFGISAFEAINRGVPVMYMQPKIGNGHDSFCDETNSFVFSKRNKASIIEGYSKLQKFSHAQREDIAYNLFDRYNSQSFVDKIDEMIEICLDTEIKFDYNNSLEQFFT